MLIKCSDLNIKAIHQGKLKNIDFNNIKNITIKLLKNM